MKEPSRVTPDLSGKRVLVVEDDPSIAIGLRINLESEGYEVHVAEDGQRGLELARSIAPDLIVLDVMLPLRNGLEVLNDLREGGYTMPIIMLSARAGEMDKVAALERGAEDYVAKPFSLAELLARVKAALRRGVVNSHERPRLTFGEIEVDGEGRTARRAGQPLDLTPTEFDVLLCLVRARGKALSRDEIFRTVWGPNHHGTARTVDNFVQQLRAKVEPDPQSPSFIQTVRGVGYRFDG